MEGINLFFEKNKFFYTFYSIFFITVLSVFIFSPHETSAATNLLTNPGAESGTTTGWTTILNGGDGWSVNFDNVVRSGSNSFQSSYGLDSLSQTVDLYANGFTANTLDTYQPAITFSVWLRTRSDQAGNYYVIFKLLKNDGTTVAASQGFGSTSSLIFVSTNTTWFEKTHTFTGYEPGVRYAYIEFGGQDHTFWAGNYGPHFDDASITVADISRPQSGGLITPTIPKAQPLSILSDSNSNYFTIKGQTITSNISSAEQMVISTDKEFKNSSWVPYQSSYHYLTPEDAFVYIKFRSSNGGESEIFTLKIPGTNQKAKEEVALIESDEKLVSFDLETPVIFNKDLRRGDQGEDVYNLQETLRKLGFFTFPSSTGYYGKITEQAVVKLQKFYDKNPSTNHFDLKPYSGRLTGDTRKLLNFLLEK